MSIPKFILIFLLSIVLIGCQLVYKPSYSLGKHIDLAQWQRGMSREQVLSTFGQLTVPCENSDNVCYIHANIQQMALQDAQMVEFVFDKERKLDHLIVYTTAS